MKRPKPSYRERYRTDPAYRAAMLEAMRLAYAADKRWGSLKVSLRRFRLTLDQYHSMQEQQDFCCYLCGEFLPLCIDHNHATSAVRRLLCSGCNSGLGGFKDNPDVLMRAAVYCATIGIVPSVDKTMRDGYFIGLFEHTPRNVYSGERHHSRRLTREIAGMIRQRALSGECCAALGREFGVSDQAILAVRNGKTWRH